MRPDMREEGESAQLPPPLVPRPCQAPVAGHAQPHSPG